MLAFKMRRRDFITVVGGAIVWPAVVQARHAGKVYRIGILTTPNPQGGIGRWNDLFDGLRDHGYVEGQNLIIEWRRSEGQAERWPELAGELVGLNVDVIVTATTPAALAAKRVTSTIPIVITAAFDPVGAGLASSLAKPGETLPDWGYSSLK